MKKIVLILCIMIGSLLVVNAAEPIDSTKRPEWSEFCPKQYLKVKVAKTEFGKKRQKPDTNYWANRREDFLFKVELCDSFPEDLIRTTCYKQVRIVETQLTQKYNYLHNYRKNKK